MNKVSLIFFMIISLVAGCKASQSVSDTNASQVDPIQVAIGKFSKTPRLFREDSVFQISKQMSSNNKNIIIVAIGRNNTKMLLSHNAKVGSKGNLASRYMEKNNKLFYWWDNDYPLTEEALAVFSKYNLLQDDEGGIITLPDNFIDDSQEYAFYFFCKNNTAIYKTIVTNKGWFYDHSPEIDCKCDSLKN